MLEEWYDPEQADTVEYYTETVRSAARRSGLTACNNCGGLGHVVMAPKESGPFKVPCAGCNPGGI